MEGPAEEEADEKETDLRYSAEISFEGFKIEIVAPKSKIKLNIDTFKLLASNHTNLLRDSEIKLSLDLSQVSLFIVDALSLSHLDDKLAPKPKDPSGGLKKSTTLGLLKPKKRPAGSAHHKPEQKSKNIWAGLIFSLHVETGEDKEKRSAKEEAKRPTMRGEKRSKMGQFIQIFQGLSVRLSNTTVIFHPLSIVKIVDILLFYKRQLEEFEREQNPHYKPIKQVFTQVSQTVHQTKKSEDNLLSISFEISQLAIVVPFLTSPNKEVATDLSDHSAIKLSLSRLKLRGFSDSKLTHTIVTGHCELNALKLCFVTHYNPSRMVKDEKMAEKIFRSFGSLDELLQDKANKETNSKAVIEHGTASLCVNYSKRGVDNAVISIHSKGMDVELDASVVEHSALLAGEIFAAKMLIPAELSQITVSEDPQEVKSKPQKANKRKRIKLNVTLQTLQGSCLLRAKDGKQLDLFRFPSLSISLFHRSGLPSIKNPLKESKTKTVVSVCLDKTEITISPSSLTFVVECVEELKHFHRFLYRRGQQEKRNAERKKQEAPTKEEKTEEDSQNIWGGLGPDGILGYLFFSLNLKGITLQLACTKDLISKLEINEVSKEASLEYNIF